MTVHSRQSVVDAGVAPSVRWPSDGHKRRRFPGRMIGRHHAQWRMTDADLDEFLEAAKPAHMETPPAPVVEETDDSIVSGLSARSARRRAS